MAYLILAGHDQPLGSLLPFIPQPSTVGYLHARRSHAASGAIIDEGPYVEYKFSSLGGGATRYQALLTQCGLLTAKTALVSVYVQDENYSWILRNGTIVKPLIGTDGRRDFVFLKNFIFLVHSLRVQA